ncbi:MAG: hypothetical protein PHC83_05700, partial [Bacteroidales bacterium]|nr:hypothetical protein [Bacteroidales bacterium]
MRPYISIYTDDPKKIINLKNLLSIESNNYYPLVYIPEQIKNKILNDDFYYVSDNTIINEYGLSNYSPIKPIRPTMPKESLRPRSGLNSSRRTSLRRLRSRRPTTGPDGSSSWTRSVWCRLS